MQHAEVMDTGGGYQMADKRLRALDEVDQMPAGLRRCVHDYGLPIVSVLVKHGVTDPRHIHEIIAEVWRGPRQQGQRTHALNAVDFLFAQGIVSAASLVRVLAENNMTIVSIEPTRAMLNASMEEVSGFNVRCTREEKHRRRLRAALRTAAEEALGEVGPKR